MAQRLFSARDLVRMGDPSYADLLALRWLRDTLSDPPETAEDERLKATLPPALLAPGPAAPPKPGQSWLDWLFKEPV